MDPSILSSITHNIKQSVLDVCGKGKLPSPPLENKPCLQKIGEVFHPPIWFNEKKVSLNETICQDLELHQSVDSSSCSPLYDHLFYNDSMHIKTDLTTQISKDLTEYYTTDTDFLRDQQYLLSHYKPHKKGEDSLLAMEQMDKIKLNRNFKRVFNFFDWDVLEPLNHSAGLLSFVSVYSVLSPLISLLVPIFILIIPFFILKIKGLPITIEQYIFIIKQIAYQNSIVQLFHNYHSVPNSQKLYLLASAFFYIFSIYQNVVSCFQFHQNMITIHSQLSVLLSHLDFSVQNMTNYLHFTKELKSHSKFHRTIEHHLIYLQLLKAKLSKITEYRFTNIKKILELGSILQTFYKLYNDETIYDSILYSFGFNGYTQLVEGMQMNLAEKHIQLATFTTSKKSSMKQMYYPPLKNNHPIKNNVKLHQNITLTGPNASGKTTMLKSVMVNVIMSQQFGCGFYAKAKINPFHQLHCYLNIPDTSARDSLFQAEARRCKSIIESIDKKKSDRHLCIFDELFSGTNPEEAEQSAFSFIQYISKTPQVTFLLTTHYINVCNRLASVNALRKKVFHKQMKTTVTDHLIKYHYTIQNGISSTKGGKFILSQMNYPEDIIRN